MLSAIKQMELYSQQYPDVVSLSQGIPGMPSDALIKYGVMQAIMENKVDTYSTPAGLLTLREMISGKLADENMTYSPEEIIITAGATEAMTATLLALTSPGDEILIPTPTYSAFYRSSQTARLTIKEIPLVEEKDWELDVTLLKRSISPRTKALILCNPNNPTGSLYDKQTLNSILEVLEQHTMYLILDEVYKNMLYDESEFYTPVIEKRYKSRVIRIVSFSKDFSLTGWRVGFLHADKTIIDQILPIHDSLVNCAPVVSQYAAMAALRHDEKIIAEHREVYKQHRKIVGNTLLQLTSFFSFRFPKGSYFFFPRLVQEKNSMKFCQDLLKKKRLALVPGTEFGIGGEGHIRICFGRSTESVIEGMERLKHYCKSYA